MKLRFKAGLALMGVAVAFMFAASKLGGTRVIASGSTLIYKDNVAPAVLAILAAVAIFAAAFLMILTKVGSFRFFAVLYILFAVLPLLGAVAEIQDHVIISDRSLTLDRMGFFSKSVELSYTDLQEAEFQSDKKQIVFYSKSRGAIYIPMGDLVMASIGKIRFALMSHGVEISNR